MILEMAAIGLLVAIVGPEARAWLAHRRRMLPAPQCACVTDDDGLLRCEGRADPRCKGGNCSVHCDRLCSYRCRAGHLLPCSSRRNAESILRCDAIEDPRCKGRNCTEHCRQHCRGTCLGDVA